MSIVGDLREALQDVVTPDLKAVVRGLADLREEMRSGNAAMRDEMRSGNTALREDIGELRIGIVAAENRSTDRLEKAELRLSERLERVYDAVKIADLTRRNSQLESEVERLRRAQQQEGQQH